MGDSRRLRGSIQIRMVKFDDIFPLNSRLTGIWRQRLVRPRLRPAPLFLHRSKTFPPLLDEVEGGEGAAHENFELFKEQAAPAGRFGGGALLGTGL